MMGSTYLEATAKVKKRSRSSFIAVFALIFAVLFSAAGFSSSAITQAGVAQADDGPLEWIVCDWAGEGSLPYLAYQVTFTDDINFLVNSKSAISSGQEEVNSGLNLLLGITHDFKEVNETILGYSLDPTDKTTTAFNGGQKVNPYDRFGFAGLSWTSYGGEWNYLKVNFCDSNATGVNMRIGALYDERLAPLSTWGGAKDSNDVRSLVAANKAAVFGADWINVIANGIFNITKGIVALTNALIGLAFSDIVTASGLGDLISGSDGIFQKLYSGIYLPFLLGIMLIMACWAFWQGIVKRAYRRTLGGIAQSIGLWILAGIVALNPLFFISLPNNISIVAQSLIVNALGTGIYAGDGLCSVGGTYTVNANGDQVPASEDADGLIEVNPGEPTDASNVEESQGLLEQAAGSIQSVVGCQIWYTYVLRPWTLGQFGTDFQNLWAKGYADTSVYADSEELANDNEAWVGDAAVPLGGGYIMHNWAIFQISTQTNAHSALGEEQSVKPSSYTDGVANDWWRIVDAVGNYNEIVQSNSIPTETACDPNSNIANSACDADETTWTDTAPVDSIVPDTSKVATDYWQTWIGAKPTDRMGVAFSSVIPAIVGNLAPLAFAGLAAMYSISLAVAMAFAPIFLLLGSWPGNGWRMFKEWGQLVLNLVMKRIVAGILLVLSLVIISMVLHQTSEINYFLGVAMISIVSIALFKFRTLIFDKASGIFSFNFASGNLKDTFTPMMQKGGAAVSGVAKNVGKVGGAALTGAAVGAKSGYGAGGGASMGAKNELRRIAYQSPILNRVARQVEQMDTKLRSDQEISEEETCFYCQDPLFTPGQSEFNGGQDRNGNWVCAACMNGEKPENGDPLADGAEWQTANFKTADYMNDKYRGVSTSDAKGIDAAVANRNGNNIELSRKLVQRSESSMDESLDKLQIIDGQTGKAGTIAEVFAEGFRREYAEANATGTIPALPKKLAPYIPTETAQQIPHLWRAGTAEATETIALVYSQAMVEYSYDVQGLSVGELSGDLDASVRDDIRTIYGNLITDNLEELKKGDSTND